MSVVELQHEGAKHRVATKGAPEAVLERCDSITVRGEAVRLTDDARAQVLAAVNEQAARELGGDVLSDRKDVERRLTFLGLVALGWFIDETRTRRTE